MVLALICALLCGGAIRRPGDLLVTLLVVILVPHSLVLNGANQYSPDAQPWAGVPLAIAFGILIIGIVNKIRFHPLGALQRENQGRRMLVLLSVLNIVVLVFIFFKSAGYFSFDFAGQYARRALAREVLLRVLQTATCRQSVPRHSFLCCLPGGLQTTMVLLGPGYCQCTSAVGSVWTEVSFCRVVSNLWPDGLFSTIRSGQSVLGCLRTIDAFAFRGVGT